MAVQAQPGEASDAEQRQLQADPHWQLVERILNSEGFARATQLRNLLRYISSTALLHPEIILREYDIACDVLRRRPDFDPSRDNIARAQVSHLRRKLEQYFATEGKDEPLILTIQKGSYTPVFRPALVPSRTEEPGIALPIAVVPDVLATQSALRRMSRPLSALAAILLSIAAIVATARHDGDAQARPDLGSNENAFVRFLGRSQGNVTIVAPDLSLVMVRRMSGAEVTLSDYTNVDYPARQFAAIKDPAIRDKLLHMSAFPNTTLNEAMIGFDFKESMQKVGVRADIRYARTLHVLDLNQGNSLLIGSPGSNPWTSLYVDRMNFRFLEINDHLHYFENAHPLPGESTRYTVVYPSEASVAVGYADIAFTENSTRSGYILLIDGSDLQASEAATRYLLHGTLPKEITALFNRPDLRSAGRYLDL